jgi:hypothetical protein
MFVIFDWDFILVFVLKVVLLSIWMIRWNRSISSLSLSLFLLLFLASGGRRVLRGRWGIPGSW